ncbi:O-methyltransferase [Falsarthrobacter nasiphocae]|uniref:O-methyltransferase YrrM n=1 Tax=Falsarthrobacter nasiphocae TaxID=189863 RepID=A0AAE3YGF9_9MICC|nr:class I SAM-dependent methyltransferase [Falsarthrobacter nasiphocae]MDR6891478.1 putative O-methyltransferase YrrM [Falsarthrobacter nasiphocae]
MSADKRSAWSYAEGFHADDDVMLAARERAFDLGIDSVPASVATALTVLTTAVAPSHVVEVGTGVGVSTLAIVRGLAPHAALTTIDPDVEHLRAARETLTDAGVPLNRLRVIAGRGQDVLPRLTKSAYEMVVIDADREGLAEYVEMSVRLLRPGGLIVINDALAADTVQQPTNRSAGTTSARNAARYLAERDDMVTHLSPVADGMILATRKR